MTLELQFTVPGEPQGKGRPRFTRQGRAYTPAKTVAYEQAIAAVASVAMPCDPINGPCSVRIDVYKGIPASWTKARRARAQDGLEIPGKPDLDNVAKAVLDALNGVVYADDQQVVRLVVQKQYSTLPRLCVSVREVLE